MLLAFPLDEDPAFEVLLATVYKDATAGSDPWSMALCHLFAGLGAALRPTHPLAGAAAFEQLALAEQQFETLGARAVAQWAVAAQAVLAGRGGAATTAVHRLMRRRVVTGNGPHTPAAPPGSNAGPHRLAVRCIGAFELTIDGVALDLGAMKPRARSVLRVLSWKAEAGLHRDEILDALWPHTDPFISAKSLHVALSQIRSVLGPCSSHLRRHGDMYTLHLDEVHDVARINACTDVADDLCRHGRPGEAMGALADAVVLMSCEFLADEAQSNWVMDERARLANLHSRLCSRLADLHLSAGDASAAVTVCETGLRSDRFSDRMWSTLVQAQQTQGHAAEAARARSRYDAVLEELGVAAR